MVVSACGGRPRCGAKRPWTGGLRDERMPEDELLAYQIAVGGGLFGEQPTWTPH